MSNKSINNVKLGLVVLAGLFFLILLLYMIGRNRNMFGKSYILRARFENIQGLEPGSNVRFAGIQSGTVKNVQIINDTIIEVMMYMDIDLKSVIRKNAVASIGTDGLVGNKVVNIIPAKSFAQLAVDGDLINTKQNISTDAILDVLSKTTDDIAIVATELKISLRRINNSSSLWSVLNDETIPANLRKSLNNIRATTEKANNFADGLNSILTDVKNGRGTVGTLLEDTSLVREIKEAVSKINDAGTEADSLVTELNAIIKGIGNDVNSGKGSVHYLLKDSSLVTKINASLDNIQKGTEGFNQNMEALKHNFFFRSYFRKLEKQKKR